MSIRKVAVAGFILLVAGCGKKPEELGGQSSPNASDKDNKFITAITEANTVEVQSGQMAEQSSTNKAVTDFAKMIVADHQEAAKLVLATSKSIGATPPPDLDADHKAILDNLKNKTGSVFDVAFAKVQVDAHKKTVDLLTDEQANGTNAEVKKLAGDLLPKMKGHLQGAEALKKAVDEFETTTKPM